MPPSPRPGRPRDPSRDDALLEATLDVLAEAGYGGFTVAAVAARAGASKATIYRRWDSKEALVLDAVRSMSEMVDPARLPDTGALRSDLLALFQPEASDRTERTLAVMAGLAAMISVDPALADAADDVMVEPWAAAHRALMDRAVERGEAHPSADVATLSRVVASMAAYRSVVLRQPFTEAFLTDLVDGVLLPALRHGRSDTEGSDTAPDPPPPVRSG